MRAQKIDLHAAANARGFGSGYKALLAAGAIDESKAPGAKRFTVTFIGSAPVEGWIDVVAVDEKSAREIARARQDQIEWDTPPSGCVEVDCIDAVECRGPANPGNEA